MQKLDSFSQAMLDAMPTPHAKMACAAVLNRYAGMTVYVAAQSQSATRQRAAENMLKQAPPMPPADVANTICQRFRVTLRTAWRDVNKAQKNVTEKCRD